MLTKALYRFSFWFMFALPLAGLTLGLTEPLTIFLTWGQWHIPKSASYEAVMGAIAFELPVYLVLLAIPKVIIYFRGTKRGDFKKQLWNAATYLGLPVIAWILFMGSTPMRIAWYLIALAAWVEAMQILIAPKLPQAMRTAWYLD